MQIEWIQPSRAQFARKNLYLGPYALFTQLLKLYYLYVERQHGKGIGEQHWTAGLCVLQTHSWTPVFKIQFGLVLIRSYWAAQGLTALRLFRGTRKKEQNVLHMNATTGTGINEWMPKVCIKHHSVTSPLKMTSALNIWMQNYQQIINLKPYMLITKSLFLQFVFVSQYCHHNKLSHFFASKTALLYALT